MTMACACGLIADVYIQCLYKIYVTRKYGLRFIAIDVCFIHHNNVPGTVLIGIHFTCIMYLNSMQ